MTTRRDPVGSNRRFATADELELIPMHPEMRSGGDAVNGALPGIAPTEAVVRRIGAVAADITEDPVASPPTHAGQEPLMVDDRVSGDAARALDGGSPIERAIARWPRRSVIVADLTAVIAALVVASAVTGAVTSEFLGNGATAAVLMAVAAVSMLTAFASQRLYTTRYLDRPADELRRVLMGSALGAGGLWAVAFIMGVEMSRGLAVAAPLAVCLLVLVERMTLRSKFRTVRAKGGLRRDVVLIGDNAESTAIRDLLDADPSLGYRVLQTVELSDGALSGNGTHTSELERIVATVQRSGARGVVLSSTALDLPSSNWLVRQLTDAGYQVELSSTLRDVASSRLMVRELGRFPILYVEPTKRTGWRSVAKRTFDVAGSLVLMLAALPLMGLAALAIKLTSPGPVLFRQERVGRDGRRFEVFKLRTMVVDAEERLAEIKHLNQADGPLFKVDRDPRVTRVGAFLRTTSLDELPQLFNVLRGEMSLVGPRPALPSEVAEWSSELHGRLRVQPGITGMWQVSGRSDASFDDYVRFDLYYVDNWSLATDVSILFRTVPAVLLRRGAR